MRLIRCSTWAAAAACKLVIIPSPQQRPLYNNKNNNTAKFTSTVVDDDDAGRCCRRRCCCCCISRCTDAADDLVPPIAATTLDHQLPDSAADSPACNCIMIEHTHTQKKSNPKENSVAMSAHAWSYGLNIINSSSPAWPMMITNSADHSDHAWAALVELMKLWIQPEMRIHCNMLKLK